MTYNKPEVVNLEWAGKAIQGAGKPHTQFPDNMIERSLTVNAYEADE